MGSKVPGKLRRPKANERSAPMGTVAPLGQATGGGLSIRGYSYRIGGGEPRPARRPARVPLEQRRGVKGGTSSGRARRLCYRRAWRVDVCGQSGVGFYCVMRG